jgi:hypothetical protein
VVQVNALTVLIHDPMSRVPALKLRRTYNPLYFYQPCPQVSISKKEINEKVNCNDVLPSSDWMLEFHGHDGNLVLVSFVTDPING